MNRPFRACIFLRKTLKNEAAVLVYLTSVSSARDSRAAVGLYTAQARGDRSAPFNSCVHCVIFVGNSRDDFFIIMFCNWSETQKYSVFFFPPSGKYHGTFIDGLELRPFTFGIFLFMHTGKIQC